MSGTDVDPDVNKPDAMAIVSGSVMHGATTPVDHPPLLPSFSRALVVSVVGLLIGLGAVLLFAMTWQAVESTESAARQESRESLKQISVRLQQLIQATEMTALSLERIVRIHDEHLTGATLRPMLESSLSAFEQRPELSYLGIVIPGTGEYGNMERVSSKDVVLWQFPEVKASAATAQTFKLTAEGFVQDKAYPVEGYDPRQRPFYQAALHAPSDGAWMPTYAWIVHSQLNTSLWGLSYVKAIRHHSGKLLAVIDADFDIPALNRFLSPLITEYRTDIQVVELGPTPRLIAASDIGNAPLPVSEDWMPVLKSSGNVFVDRMQVQGERRWVAAQRLQLKGGLSWMVITSRPAPLIDTPLRHQLLQVLGMGAAMAVVLALVSLRLARRFGRPLTELEQRVARIGQPQAGAPEGRMEEASQGFRETQLLGTALDRMEDAIHQQALAKEQQAASIRLKGAIFDSTSAAMFSLDETMVIVEWNAAAERMFGLSRDKVVGRQVQEMLLSPHDPLDWAAILATEDTMTLEFIGIDGAFDAELRQVTLSQESQRIHTLILNDITERKQYEQYMHHLAMYDGLTGLPNRNLIRERITKSITQAQEDHCLVSLLYLDLGRFKVVNEGYGHIFGNSVLREVGAQLLQYVREGDTVARLSGDEFLILLADVIEPAEVERVAHRVIERFQSPIVVQGRDIHLSLSMGVSIFPHDGESADELIDRADMAMYRAKELGHNVCLFFTREMGLAIQRRVDMEIKLRHAVINDQLHIVYQPKVNLESGRISGCEALLRWQHPELGAVSPCQFIPVAEDSGLIVPIGDWVLRTACTQAQAWIEAGLPPVCVAVNISVRQFLQQDVVAWVANTLQETGLSPQWLELELTESLIAQDIEKVTETINQLKELGIKLSIDDFGTGYSSLNYLKSFRVDTLKIDQSFVRTMLTEREDSAIVLAVIALAQSLGFKVIAEGVEEEAHCQFLQQHACDEMQGYYFSKPVTAAEFEHMLRDDKRLPSSYS